MTVVGFTDPTVVLAGGVLVQIVSCLSCGAAVLLDPRDDLPMMDVHLAWHVRGG